MKNVFKVFKYLLLAILLFLAGICMWVFIQTKISPNKIPSIFGYKPFIVLSGSMETEISKGDLVIVKVVDTKGLKKNDIVAFRDEKNYVVTHRIVNVIKDGKKISYVTKGDNNNANDFGTVSTKDIEGKYVKKIKGFGNVFLVLQRPMTLAIVLVIIVLIGVLWIMSGNNKLSKDERKELEQLRKEAKKK